LNRLPNPPPAGGGSSRHDHGRPVGRWILGYAIVGSVALIVAAGLFLFYFGGLADLHP
jgi:hypothetical protein